MKILELQEVSKSFEGLRAVDYVSLSVEKGSVTGLIGPNGSGKTTLFNLISGLEKADSGKILFEQKRIDGKPPDKIFQSGLVRSFQNPRVFSGMTVQENFMLTPPHQLGENPWRAPIHKLWQRQDEELSERTHSYLERLNLLGVWKSWGSELSGGQMKLTDMGRTLMGNPRMLLLDEPTAGVAPNIAEEIFQHIKKLNSDMGLTMMIIEHRLEMLFDIVDNVYVMNLGKIIAAGKTEEIVKDREVVDAYLGK